MAPESLRAEVIAHRGASHDAPENTLAAVQLAWDQHADAVELDFQLSRDGQLIALHDDDLLRTAGAPIRADQASLAELQIYDVGRWKGQAWVGQRIVTLADMFAALPADKRFYLELKAGLNAVPELARVVRASRVPAKDLFIMSLDRPVCAAVKQSLEEHKAYWIVPSRGTDSGRVWTTMDRAALPLSAEEMISAAKEDGLDGLDFDARGPIDADLMERLKKGQLDSCVWTVDEPDLARRLLTLGISRITTNRPGWLREQLAG